MAANITDYFNKAADGTGAYPVLGKVASARSAGDAVLVCEDLTGWSTETPVHFSTYRLTAEGLVDTTSQTDWKGIVSGNTITNLTRIAGAADSGNAVGDVVQVNPTIGWLDDLITGLLKTYTQSGLIRDGAVKTAMLADDAVETNKIANKAVKSANIDYTTFGDQVVAHRDALPNTVSITAPADGLILVHAETSATWGWGGGTAYLDIKSSDDELTVKTSHGGGVSGGDSIGRQIVSTVLFSGAKAGRTYTFTAQRNGNLGNTPSSIITAMWLPGN